MLRVGITGQAGFIGTHLFNYLGLQEGVARIPFAKSFFHDQSKLNDFVKQCDVIVHLAAMNRHNDPEMIYQTNIGLIRQLIQAMEAENVTPHVIFSSSTQEERNNQYAKSKKEGRDLFIEWAHKHNALFTGLIIPNVFGPFGAPYYNSVIATFSHQLTHNETPQIDNDGILKLIYVGELINEIFKIIVNKQGNDYLLVPFSDESKVSEILCLLEGYKKLYFEKNMFPEISSNFELNLFNTFRSYFDNKNYFPVSLKMNTDNRGTFVETVKEMTGGQFSFSTTHPGITRGDHFHTRKIERFAVIKGRAAIELRRIGTDEILRFDLDGKQPAFVDMPIWYTHNITNTGTDDLLTLFWINEFYNAEDPDTYFEKVRLPSNIRS